MTSTECWNDSGLRSRSWSPVAPRRPPPPLLEQSVPSPRSSTTARTGQYVAMAVHRRFWGSLVRSRARRGGFWNTLTAREDQMELGRWPLRTVVIPRDATSAVRFQKVSLPLWRTTDVVFDKQGEPRRYVFRPFRPRQLAHHLRATGWHVVDSDELNVRTALQRLGPRRRK